MTKQLWPWDFSPLLTSPRRIAVTFLFLLAISLPTRCQTNEIPLLQANREIGASFEPSSIAYREYVGGAVQDSEHGWIPGFGIKASLMRNMLGLKQFLIEATYDFNTGSSDHRSKSLDGGNPLNYQSPFRSQDVFLGIGKGFLPASRLILTPEIGFEYREWLRKLPEALLAIQENYTFWAPGAALSATYDPLDRLILTARAGVGYTVSPTNDTIGNPAGQVPNLDLGLGNGPVWRAKLGLDSPITRGLHAFADVDYSHFEFGQSAVAHYGQSGAEYEPKSVTDLTKVHVGLAWSF